MLSGAYRPITLCALLLARALAASADVPPVDLASTHGWTKIAYPPLEWVADGDRLPFEASLSHGSSAESALQLEVDFHHAQNETQWRRPKKVSAQIRTPSGTLHAKRSPLAPESLTRSTNLLGASHIRCFAFPWGANNFDEGWIELDVEGQRFCFEVPYGFLRDANDSRPSGEPDRGGAPRPRLHGDVQLVPWENVEYRSVLPCRATLSREDIALQLKIRNPTRVTPEGSDTLPDVDVQCCDLAQGRPVDWPVSVGLPCDTRSAVPASGPQRRFDSKFGGIVQGFELPETSPRGRDWRRLIVHVGELEQWVLVPSSVVVEQRNFLPPQQNLWADSGSGSFPS